MPALAEKRMPGADLRDLLLYAISHNVSILEGLADPERDKLLDEQIAAGDSTAQYEIPDDWRTRAGPEKCHSLERRANIGKDMRARFAVKPSESAATGRPRNR